MIVGTYALHLYCDSPEHVYYKDGYCPGEYTGKTEREAMKEARAAGWKIDRKAGTAICPLHARKGSK